MRIQTHTHHRVRERERQPSEEYIVADGEDTCRRKGAREPIARPHLSLSGLPRPQPARQAATSERSTTTNTIDIRRQGRDDRQRQCQQLLTIRIPVDAVDEDDVEVGLHSGGRLRIQEEDAFRVLGPSNLCRSQTRLEKSHSLRLSSLVAIFSFFLFGSPS